MPTFHSRSQTANAAHIQLNRHTGNRRLVQLGDNGWIRDAVALDANARVFTRSFVGNFTINQPINRSAQKFWRNQQSRIRRAWRDGREAVEETNHIRSDILARGKETQICIKTRR